MEQVIKRAIEGGMKEGEKWQFLHANKYWSQWLDGNGTLTNISVNNYLLDPLFWQALGKAEGWTTEEYHDRDEIASWYVQWHRLIDHLAEGKDADSFFNNLLK